MLINTPVDYSGVSNNRTVWNKPTGQGIFPKLINAQGCHSTVQYRANKRKVFLENK